MKNYKKDGDLVMVDWEDSRQPVSSWQFANDIPDPSPVKCSSVGWVLHQDKSVISLAPNVGDGDNDVDYTQVSGLIIIPISCVKEVTVLEAAGK